LRPTAVGGTRRTYRCMQAVESSSGYAIACSDPCALLQQQLMDTAF
jgi:hypothetical protein